MPREIPSSEFLNHLIGGVTTLSMIWTITRKDSTVFYFTDADADITYDGHTYKAANSGTLSAMQQSSKLDVDNFDFSIILDETEISKEDVISGIFDYAEIKIWMINRNATANGALKMIRGRLGEVHMTDDHKASIEFRSLVQLLSQGIGRVYSHECNADLGDTRCGVDLESYTFAGTVTSIKNNQIFLDSERSEADDYFNYGMLIWTSGNNNGLSMEIQDFVNATGTFTLVSPMPFTVAIGDTYSAIKGCDKQKATCIADFDNVLNFRGFAEIPGSDFLHTIPDVNPNEGIHGGGW